MAINIASLSKSEAEIEREREDREAAFRSKVSIQQFLNANGPLFAVFARAGVAISDVVEGQVLRGPAFLAMRLATLVAARIYARDPADIAPKESRPFRAAAASYVAARWLADMEPDVERAATEIASAVALADGSWNHDVFRDEGLSDDASLMITAANAATSLARSVEKYDFRGGRTQVLSRLVRETAEAAARTARMMLGDRASETDVRNVTQTAARNLSALLESCYERRAREVVALLANMPEERKREWYEDNDPIGDVLAAFREWTICLGGFAVAASRDMSSGKAPTPVGGRAGE